MPESLSTKLQRWRFNLFPAYWGTGARVTYIAADYREIRIELPLSWRTRNYVGTIFGGSIYAAVDPIYMIMLIKNLGRDYVVWDKAASVRFREPARTTLHATFQLSQQELDTIRSAVAGAGKVNRMYRVELLDSAGTLHAEVEKTVHVRRRESS